MSATSGHRVVALVLDQIGLLDLAAPTHLFGYCGPPLYRLEMATCEPGRVRTSAGPDLYVEHGLGVLRVADTVIVPGYEDETAAIPPAALSALRAAAERGARIMSICTGAFALAEAGLLDGLTATTHWAAADLLASKYPRVTVQADMLYIDQGQILTSAGIAAGLDLCLHVIRRDHGAAIAAGIARRTVVAPHRDGGQAQFIDLPIPKSDGSPGSGNTAISRTREWARARLPSSLSVAQLAAHAQMSPRTFLRRFRAETGETPAAWITAQRVTAAQVMLESTRLSIEQIAHRAGLGSAESLRIHFRDQLHTTPTAYRRAFNPDPHLQQPGVVATAQV